MAIRTSILALLAAAALALAAPLAAASGLIAFGADNGDGPRVVIRSDIQNDGFPDIVADSFYAFSKGFKGGVRVAVGDFDSDADMELVTASGPGMQATIRVWDLKDTGEVLLLKEQFTSFAPNFTGGLYVASGDLDNDGKDTLIVGAGKGEPRVWLFDDIEAAAPNPGDGLLGNSEIDTFLAFEPKFTGGVRVDAGITNLDNKADIVCGHGPGTAGPMISIFRDVDNDSIVSDEPIVDTFLAFDNAYKKGVYVAVGNVATSTGNGEVCVSTAGGGQSLVRVFQDSDNDAQFSDQSTVVFDSLTLSSKKIKGGVKLACANLDNNTRRELVTCLRFEGFPIARFFQEGTDANFLISDETMVKKLDYIDTLVGTFFKKSPFVDWSN